MRLPAGTENGGSAEGVGRKSFCWGGRGEIKLLSALINPGRLLGLSYLCALLGESLPEGCCPKIPDLQCVSDGDIWVVHTPAGASCLQGHSEAAPCTSGFCLSPPWQYLKDAKGLMLCTGALFEAHHSSISAFHGASLWYVVTPPPNMLLLL